MNHTAVPAGRDTVAHWLTFDRAATLLPVVTGLSAGASIALVEYKVWRTPHFAYVSPVVAIAASAFVLSIALSAVLILCSRSGWIGKGSAVSWLVALEMGVLLLPVIVVLLARGIAEEEMTGFALPVLNKRWLIALYNLSIATCLVFPLAVERWRTTPRDWSSAASIADGAAPRRSLMLTVAGQLVIVALCWFLGGPPWHLERHHRVVDWHEQLHLGPLLAIFQGHLPFVGAAATPYGPGSQWLTFALMKSLGSFDLVSFRTAWAIQQFMATLAVGVAACWWLGFLPAIAVVLLSFTYSPVAFFQTAQDGTWFGLYGWSNACRYLAPLLVVPMLAESATRATKSLPIIVIGAVWAVGAFLAQESLTTTGTAIVLLLALLWLTRTIALSRAVWLLRDLAIGFVCVLAPVLAYYAWYGAAGEFVRTYFFFARAVVAGFSNSWWPLQDAARPDRITYYLTLPFLLGCGVCALWRVPDFEVAPQFDRRRRLFLAFVCVMLVCYQTALTRSDYAHLMNTMIALPFLVVLGVIDLPGWIATRAPARWLVRVAFLVVVLLLFPTLRLAAEWRRFTAPVARFQAYPTPPMASPPDDRIAFRRMTPLLADEPQLVDGGTVPVREFLEFATEVRSIVGNRKTYFLQMGWTTTGALIAFMADLQVADHPLGGELLDMNDDVKASVAAHIRAHPQDYEAFIGPSLDDPEARAFLDSHPAAVRIEKTLGTATVHILLASR
jgi:hypothetical protein